MMAKVAKGKFKCPRCDRTFSMAAHLARHKNTIHAPKTARKAGKKKARPKKKVRRRRAVKQAGRVVKRPRRTAKRAGRPVRRTRRTVKRGRRSVKRVGRPRGIAGRLSLRALTLEQLGELITAARAQARRKMAELRKTLK